MTVVSSKEPVVSRKRKLEVEATSEVNNQKKLKTDSTKKKKKAKKNDSPHKNLKAEIAEAKKANKAQKNDSPPKNENAELKKSKKAKKNDFPKKESVKVSLKEGSKTVKKFKEPFKKGGSKSLEKKSVPEKFDHAKAKEIRLARRKQKKDATIFEVGLKAKQLWETFRPEECTAAKRNELLQELISIIEGKVVKLCLAHDTVRVIESLLLHGNAAQRAVVFKEVMESKSLILLSKSKFGSFVALKMLKYGTKEQREAIANMFDGQTAKLMKHKVANAVVELYYNDYAGAVRRNQMLQEFCGPEFTKFKDDEIRTVSDLMKKYPEKERDIYKNLHENVSTLITKGCYNHSLVHTAIYNFMNVAKEKERAEIISHLRDACVHIMHSADGAKASMIALWFGNNKDRKAIIRNFKTFVPKIATEEHGHMVLMAIFDSMDDTVFVCKTILSEIKSNFGEIVANKYGKKVINYLLAPRSTVLFHPQVLEKLKVGDGNQYSKKDPKLRGEELLKDISSTIVQHLTENVADLLSQGETIFIATVLNHALGDLKKAMEALVAAILKENELIEKSGIHQMLKKIIQADKKRNESENPVLFSDILLEAAAVGNIDAWLRCNRGGFLLVAILETEIPKLKQLLEEKLKTHKPTLSTQKSQGVECLKSKLGF